MGEDKVHQALHRISSRLDELGIPYAVAGGMALNAHGFRRATVDVDVLVTSEGLQRVHEALEGLGYVPPFTGSKNLRDAESSVRIEFLVTGQFPGDGKPKPVAFPDPAAVAYGDRWHPLLEPSHAHRTQTRLGHDECADD